jgi:cephalosporin hydroxylase
MPKVLKPFTSLRQSIVKRIYRAPPIARFISRQFHRSFYYSRNATWKDTYWFGAPVLKCPLDLWVYQEILSTLKPAVIIECGTNRGGSAYYMGTVCDLIGHGTIVTIDIMDIKAGHPTHPRATYLIGSSTSEAIVRQVREFVGDRTPVMVVLDSDHTRDHVLKEMELYGPLVTPGSYIIVEDSNINGHPVNPASGPGPMEAIDAFLARNDAFAVDASREKYFLSFNPRGYLKRVK